MAMRGIDDDEIDAGCDETPGALETVGSDAHCGGNAQTALFIDARVRVAMRLLDVLHRDEADAAILVVDDEQLLDAIVMQQALGFFAVDAFAHSDQLLVISFERSAGSGWSRSGRRGW